MCVCVCVCVYVCVDLSEGHSPSRLSESELRHFCLFRVD